MTRFGLSWLIWLMVVLFAMKFPFVIVTILALATPAPTAAKIAVFVDGQPILDPRGLSDEVPADATIHVIQALSGG